MMDNLVHRVYRYKLINDKLEWEFRPVSNYEEQLLQNSRKADLVEQKQKLKNEFHLIEKMATRKQNPTIGSLANFLTPFGFLTVSSNTIKNKGRKWIAEHLTGKSKATLHQFMDEVEKFNKAEKDAEKRYEWDIVVLKQKNNRTRVKNAFILRVRLSPTNGLFVGIIDGDWHIFY
ncbi:hypothetical protein [Shewanella sp. KT0246]|uniref:hypothetical protein n=1 Tax=Shewanella sp. KT0246 TaxID=2815912 RepID=UPI001BB8825A|nr:hypothetical protein [Shewanella sp. KT0246]GIU50260.1 hypothetical protein TUM4249_10080 [Shewanella sp. KT0246]